MDSQGVPSQNRTFPLRIPYINIVTTTVSLRVTKLPKYTFGIHKKFTRHKQQSHTLKTTGLDWSFFLHLRPKEQILLTQGISSE